jgi:hypothetical protein
LRGVHGIKHKLSREFRAELVHQNFNSKLHHPARGFRFGFQAIAKLKLLGVGHAETSPLRLTAKPASAIKPLPNKGRAAGRGVAQDGNVQGKVPPRPCVSMQETSPLTADTPFKLNSENSLGAK